MPATILCIGEALIDMICTDQGAPLSEGLHFEKKPGGAPTNVAAAIAALGGSVELIAKVGDDPFGKQLKAVLEEFGVSTRWMLTDKKYFTTMAFVSLMKDGERDFVFNRGADGQLTWQEAEAVDLSDISIAHFGSATGFLPGPLREAYYGLLEKSARQNIFISFDPNYRHLLFAGNTDSFIEHSWRFLAASAFYKLSDEEALLITRCSTLEDAAALLLEKTHAIFAITLGKQGTLLGFQGRTEIIPSIPVNPVDTTGAGDAFVGAVLQQLNGYPAADIPALSLEQWRAIILNANKAGARTCEYLGAMEAFRHLNKQILL